ncbi:MAG: DUF1489 family protein [Rhizobiaceae bacterium]
MVLNLVKLCVGCDSVEHLVESVERRKARQKKAGEALEYIHTTRMIPKRAGELVQGGSLYWVIKGNIQCRQRLIAVRPFTDANGISRCDLVMEPMVISTYWQPKRAFQGWRYLKGSEAPADLTGGKEGMASVPAELRLELAELGLL